MPSRALIVLGPIFTDEIFLETAVMGVEVAGMMSFFWPRSARFGLWVPGVHRMAVMDSSTELAYSSTTAELRSRSLLGTVQDSSESPWISRRSWRVVRRTKMRSHLVPST